MTRLVGRERGVLGQVRVVRVFLLFPERLDAVGQLDHLDAAAEAGAREVGADFGEEVVVGGGLAGEPGVLEGLLCGC